MRYVIARLTGVFLVGAVLALVAGLVLSKCDTGRPGSPFTQAARISTAAARHAAQLQCTRAYGDCQVTEYIHVRANGTEWVETCFEAEPVTEGHGGIFVAVNYCYRP